MKYRRPPAVAGLLVPLTLVLSLTAPLARGAGDTPPASPPAAEAPAGRASVPEGDVLRSRLIGLWGASTDSGQSFWAIDEYREDGTIEATGTSRESGEAFRVVGSYIVKGRFSCVEVTQSSDESAFPVGLKFCAEILSIDDSMLRFRYTDSGRVDTLYRTTRLPVAALGSPAGEKPGG